MRKIGIIHAALSLILIAGATRAGETSAGDVSTTQPIQIEIPVFEGGEGLDFFIHCARAFEKERPNIKVDLYGDPRMQDKVRIRILEGTFPEGTNAKINFWPLIRAGDIEPLDKYLDEPNSEHDSTWRNSFLPGSLGQYVYNGHTYGIPFAYFANVMWYNKAMFESHGWEPPRTWDEFFALCDKIKSAGIAPMAFQGRYPYYIGPLIDVTYYHLAGPERYLQQRLVEPGSYANPQCEESFALVNRLATNYFQPGALGMSHTESQLQFFLGHTAMICCGSWLKSEMMGKIPDGFRLGEFNLPLPNQSTGDPGALNVTSLYYFVMSHSKHPREAVEFFRFMTSRRMAGEFSRMRDIPTAVRGASAGNLSPDLSDLVKMMDAAKTTYGVVPGEGYPEMDQYLEDAAYDLIANKSTPKDVALHLESVATELRERAANPTKVNVRHLGATIALLCLFAFGLVYWVKTAISSLRNRRSARQLYQTAEKLPMRWHAVLLFTLPALTLYSVFIAWPCLRSFLWSLHQWDGLTNMNTMPYVGLLNFKRLLLENDQFWIALRNNLFLMLVVPAFIVPLALFLAACISSGVIGSGFFRIIFFFPNLLGSVAITLLWMHLYEGGVINGILTHIGLSQFNNFTWLEPDHLYWALIPLSVWGACGFYMVLYLAAMENIPLDLYEAADIDGASRWRQFWQITLPLIWDILSVSIVFLVIGGMNAFEIIWLLTNQRPTTDDHVVATRMFQVMFNEFNVGQATAIAVILFLMVFLGSAGTLRALRRETVEM